jgi:hypothetical protein
VLLTLQACGEGIWRVVAGRIGEAERNTIYLPACPV